MKRLIPILLVLYAFGCTNSRTSTSVVLPINTGGAPFIKFFTKSSTPPAQKLVKQGPTDWYKDIPSGDRSNVVVKNVKISNGGLVHALGASSIVIDNCSNVTGPKNGGMYAALMAWPPAPQGQTQAAIPKISMSNCYFKQGSAEAAARTKCDNFSATDCAFEAYLQPNGAPWKQVFEARHGHTYTFTRTTWLNGWPSFGRQKTADKSIQGWHWETSQNIDEVFCISNTFTRWTNPPWNSKVVDRPPGCKVIHYINCTFPDGKKVTKDE